MSTARTFLLLFLLLLSIWSFASSEYSPEEYLSRGDQALSNDEIEVAIGIYQDGLKVLDEDESSLVTAVSLYTNLGTALSTVGKHEEAIEIYKKGLLTFDSQIDDIVEKQVVLDAKAVSAQASFFLAMEYQEINEIGKAADAYAFANTLDPNHWASLANLGAVLYDDLKEDSESLVAYNKALEILTSGDVEPTDPPEDPEYVLSELHWRIGLCLTRNPNRKCAKAEDPQQEVSCGEMAKHSFSMALKFNPSNEFAKHMLATLTADATMTRASNVYVKSLFDDYAGK